MSEGAFLSPGQGQASSSVFQSPAPVHFDQAGLAAIAQAISAKNWIVDPKIEVYAPPEIVIPTPEIKIDNLITMPSPVVHVNGIQAQDLYLALAMPTAAIIVDLLVRVFVG